MRIPTNHSEIIEIFVEEIDKFIAAEKKRKEQINPYVETDYLKGVIDAEIQTAHMLKTILNNIFILYMRGKYGDPLQEEKVIKVMEEPSCSS